VRAVAIVVAFVVVGFCAAAWWVIWRPLPVLDGTVNVAGLRAKVTVDRDAHGTPWIQAGSLDDLMFAQGYVMAQDRLWQMDLLRRIASGHISELVGPMTLDVDREERTLGLAIAADAAAARMDPQAREIVEAYCRGVNAFIEQHKSRLPFEFTVLRYKPDPWTPRDTFLISAYMWQTLTTTWKAKLNRARISAKVGPERARDVFTIDSPLDHFILGAEEEGGGSQGGKSRGTGAAGHGGESRASREEHFPAVGQAPSVGASLISFISKFMAEFEAETSEITGSNNFTVNGSHTASGKPILANDTHLEFSMPGIWYMVHLTAPGWNVAGFTFPGCPLVVIGHNDRIAWGFTNSNADVQDLFVETMNPENPLQYKANGKWVDAQARNEVIRVRGKEDVNLQVITTRHGPLVKRDPQDANRAYALQWTMMEAGSLDFSYPLLGAATDWNSFLEVMRKIDGPGQNGVYADVDGNIGYIMAAKIPIRASGHGEVPVDGSNDNAEWTGYIPFDELPKALNPPDGVIATANARTVGPAYKYFLTERWAGPERTERMYELLSGRKDLRVSDANAVQNDIVSLPDKFLAGQVLAASALVKSQNVRTNALLGALREWDGRATAESAQTSFMEFTRHALIRHLLSPYLGAGSVKEYELWEPDADYDNVWWRDKIFLQNVLTQRPPAWLPQEFHSYDELLMKCADEAAEHVLVHWRDGGDGRGTADLSAAAWGHFHLLEILHPLGQKPPLRGFLSIGPMGQSGTTDTVRAMGYRHGPAMRFVADLSNFDNSLMEIPAGESGQPGSKYYKDEFEDWFGGRGIAAPFSAAVLEKVRAHRLTLMPRANQ
jgi:penicillin amidase